MSAHKNENRPLPTTFPTPSPLLPQVHWTAGTREVFFNKEHANPTNIEQKHAAGSLPKSGSVSLSLPSLLTAYLASPAAELTPKPCLMLPRGRLLCKGVSSPVQEALKGKLMHVLHWVLVLAEVLRTLLPPGPDMEPRAQRQRELSHIGKPRPLLPCYRSRHPNSSELSGPVIWETSGQAEGVKEPMTEGRSQALKTGTPSRCHMGGRGRRIGSLVLFSAT